MSEHEMMGLNEEIVARVKTIKVELVDAPYVVVRSRTVVGMLFLDQRGLAVGCWGQ